MRTDSTLPVVFLALLGLTSCGPKTPPAPPVPEAPPVAQAPEAVSAPVLSALDLAADPCDDFYQYACGGWVASTELPADQSRWTRSFSVIVEENRAFLKTTLDELAANPPADAPEQARLGQFYGACMNTDAIEEAGLTGIQPLLDRIDRVKVRGSDNWMKLLADLHLAGADLFWGGGPEGDYKEPTLTILHMGQAGLGLPDRDYYLKDDEKSVATQGAYEAHIATILELSGVGADDAKAQAAKVMEIVD